LVIDNWTDHGVTTNMGEINLKAGKRYKIKMEYYQTLGGAVTRLSWILPSERDKMNAQKMPPTRYVQVYLPKSAGWYDFWRGSHFDGGQTVEVPAPIDEMPLFVKAGSIVPMGPYLQYAMEKPADPLEIRIYSGADADFLLYEDEGDNYNYEKGVYATIALHWDENGQTLTIGDRKGSFPGMLKKRTFNIVFVGKNHGTGIEPFKKADKKVTYTGKKLVIKK
jgi:alpha-D-xyloside xylohydrolase